MEMESSRRSAVDRLREPGPKKPRLTEEAERDRVSNGVAPVPDRSRPFPRAPSGGGSQPLNPRFRTAEREREKEDPARGGAAYQQQQQELVAQYKTALAELTFNSKPIITNLTIIAGENLHAAKGIAATICANILEVPSEQKLPSLYLLDSIVKNIGRDYIKYFAAKLPEVFCKAYKQVDSSIHPGMRHLFGTWKGVFPPAPLQIIEKELGFAHVINGSSGATASRPESQNTQRPPHSIHVNPKYLEARQRLQQSSKVKDTSSDDNSDVVTPVDESERFDRTALVGSTRQWADLPIKMPNIQRPQREQLNDPIHEKKGYRDVRDQEFPSGLPRPSDLGAERISEKVKERDGPDKPLYGVAGTTSEASTSRRNDFDINPAYGNYRAPGSGQMDRQLPSVHMNNTNKNSRPTPKNWKNSEEEEYIWDERNSRLTDYGGTNSSIKGGWNNEDADKPASSQRGKWMPEHLDSQWNKFDAFSQIRKTPGGEGRVPPFMDTEEHLPQPRGQQDSDLRTNTETSSDPFSLGRATSGRHTSLVWPPREPPPLVVGLDRISSRISGQSDGQDMSHSRGFSTSSSLARPGLLSQTLPSSVGPLIGSVGMFGQQRQQPLQPPSPSAQSPPSHERTQHQKSRNSIDHDHLQSHSFSQMGQKPMQLPGQFNRMSHAPVTQDSFAFLGQNHIQQPHTSMNSQHAQPPQHPPASAASLTQMRHHLPFLRPSPSDIAQQQAQAKPPPSIQPEKPPLSIGNHETQAFRGTSQSNNPADVSGPSSTHNLLAAIMKSGLIPNNSASSFQSLNMLPPLPSGPPPIQALTSSAASVVPSPLGFPTSQGNTPALVPPPMRAVLPPPLPPGPPPASSLLATTSQFSNPSNPSSAAPNPLSGLLSSLLAKGIISKPATELPAADPAPSKLPDQNSIASSIAALTPSNPATTTIPTPPVKEVRISEPSPPIGASLLQSTASESENLLGFDFKPEIIREFHPSVICSLFDDLKHQCNICGLRFRLQEQLPHHLDWHALKNSEASRFDRASRKWYTDKSNWIAGIVGPLSGPVATAFHEKVAPDREKCEPMVPADESQSICALCGEPFEDFYSDERDEWMYKGTVYLNSAYRQGDMGSPDESMGEGLIVHTKCVSSSDDDMEVAGHDKACC